jgi:hypothetical protein
MGPASRSGEVARARGTAAAAAGLSDTRVAETGFRVYVHPTCNFPVTTTRWPVFRIREGCIR